MKIQIHLVPVGLSKPLGVPAAHGPPPSTLWHYTTCQKLDQILASGEIKPSTACLDVNEKPVVWFSARPTWEPTATKCSVPGKLGQLITAHAQGGLARIAVSSHVSPYSIEQLHLVARTSLQTCAGLILAGLEMGGDPHDWFFTPDSVPLSLFRAIELYDFAQDQWQAVDIAELACRN